MRIEYDKNSHGLFIDFVAADADRRYARSKEVSPGVVVDFDLKGRAIALELEDVRGILDEEDVAAIVTPQISSGADLAKFRAQLGLTQDRLAALLQVPRNTIARWERGELAIEKSRMLALALAAIAGGERGRKNAAARPKETRRTYASRSISSGKTTAKASAARKRRAGRRRHDSAGKK
jgi:DNA-binding XRE family transcriptional regulator